MSATLGPVIDLFIGGHSVYSKKNVLLLSIWLPSFANDDKLTLSIRV